MTSDLTQPIRLETSRAWRTYLGGKMISAWILGASGFVVTQLLIRLPVLTALQSQPWFISFSENNSFLFAFALAFPAGLFELAGRFVVAKLMQKNLNYHRALAAGLGHGGIEAMILVGITYLNNILYIFMINSGTFDAVVSEAVATGRANEPRKILKNALWVFGIIGVVLSALLMSPFSDIMSRYSRN